MSRIAIESESTAAVLDVVTELNYDLSSIHSSHPCRNAQILVHLLVSNPLDIQVWEPAYPVC